ncbi:hypothetical protein Dimus_031565 [Dionaea muscipula]
METTGEHAQAVENEDEVDSEKTESEEVIDDDVQTEEVIVRLAVEEEGRKKRCLKNATSTGPAFKKAKTANLPRAKSQREENLLPLSVLSGHAIQRVVNADARQCKMIACLNEERNSEQMTADVDMVMKENHSLEKKNAELEAALEKEREERKKADEKIKTIESRLESFRKLKSNLDRDLNARKKKHEKLQIELDKACLQMDGLEDKWIARVESLRWQLEDLEKDWATMVPLALIEDTPPTMNEGKTKVTSPKVKGEEERSRHELEGIGSESINEIRLHPNPTLAPIM